MKLARLAAVFFACAVIALSRPTPGQSVSNESAAYQAYLKGDALFVERKFPESTLAIDEALRLDPKLVPALTLRAKLAMAAKQFLIARESLERALAVDPGSEYAEFLYGFEAYQENDLQAALPRFEKSRRMNPSDPRAALYLGLTSESLGLIDTALVCYEDAARLERKAGKPYAGSLLAGARLLGLLGREEEAGRLIAQALQAGPELRDAHFEFARVLLRKGDASAAAIEGETALRLAAGDTTDDQIHYLLVRAYRESGNATASDRHAAALKR